jgi:hypothetical protein
LQFWNLQIVSSHLQDSDLRRIQRIDPYVDLVDRNVDVVAVGDDVVNVDAADVIVIKRFFLPH